MTAVATATWIAPPIWSVPTEWAGERAFILCGGESVKAQRHLIPMLRGRFVAVTGLSGPHELLIDGKVIDKFGPKADESIVVVNGPDFEQVEKLREAIVAKNELYFHRWRPQNETYLFGFRKHEQGKNAKEIAEFDPFITKAEEEIATIRKSLK